MGAATTRTWPFTVGLDLIKATRRRRPRCPPAERGTQIIQEQAERVVAEMCALELRIAANVERVTG